MTEEAKEARRAYKREWSRKNRDKIREYHKRWRRNNPDKVQAAQERYWERKAASAKEENIANGGSLRKR